MKTSVILASICENYVFLTDYDNCSDLRTVVLMWWLEMHTVWLGLGYVIKMAEVALVLLEFVLSSVVIFIALEMCSSECVCIF